MVLRSYILILPLALTACQSTAAVRAPATVDLSDPTTKTAVTSALAQAVGKARIELGASDGSTITVLPPPLGPHESHSTAQPIRFDIVIEDGVCLAVRRDTQQAWPLPGVTCRPKST
ncbi:hypothetical protein ABI_01230 [Asticcacaulis biprosthecium C19]|uniref:Lipoprotein n=1 Tax=Asticcacaulis biprosthecium C19 TaxID=715226 RepID=F4QHY2_9CAUL|nr:hypothetical protein [Asticcacaulis biprosthecium]EGF91693.1 hypothetical protein ABI_01230 [Asticcacaulis biprosthecium C19]